MNEFLNKSVAEDKQMLAVQPRPFLFSANLPEVNSGENYKCCRGGYSCFWEHVLTAGRLKAPPVFVVIICSDAGQLQGVWSTLEEQPGGP